MIQPTDRTKSNFTQQREQREQVAVALATERLPWHPAIGERFGIERSDWRALVEAVFPAAKTSEGVILALSYCKARKLDPFKRVVHVVPIWSKEKRAYVETVWPGIGESRTTAMRTKLFAGCDDTKFGDVIEQTWTAVGGEDDQGNKTSRQITMKFPEWAQITVYRMVGEQRCAIPGPRVYWLETYASIGRTTVPNDMWQRRPRGQLEKCAEAAALRRAFPEELGDEATADEMGDYTGPIIDPEGNPVGGGAPQTKPESSRTTSAAPRARPDETSTAQQGQQQTSHTEQASQPSQTSRDTEDWRSNHGETTRDSTVGTQTASAATGETKSGPTTQERKPEPKPTAANDTAAKTAETTAADKTSPPVDQRSSETQQVDTASEKGVFEAWVVDAAGNETTPDPYADAMQFAAALAALCAGQAPDVISSIVDNNEGAIADCRDVSAPAAAIIDAAITPKSSSDDRVIEGRVVEDQGGTQEQAETSTGATPVVEALAVPLTPGGKPHWPNYTVAAKERLDQCRSVAEAEAWMAVNKPVFFGKCTIASENQIQRHYDQTLTKLSAGSDDAEPVDADRVLADKICAELKSSTTLDNLRAMNGRKEVIDALTRWQKDRPELFNELRTVGTQRLKELQAAG